MPSDHSSHAPAIADRSPPLPLGRIFLAALAIRWAYDLALFAALGEAGLIGPDSLNFLSLANTMADGLRSGTLIGWDWLGAQPYIMPLITWMFTLAVMLFGKLATLGYVMVQGAADAGTCVLVCLMAQTIARRFAVPAGIAAAINPTQIVLSGIFYTDTLFLSLCALSLYASLRWLQSPSWTSASLIGLSIGAAALIRALILPWSVFLLLFLLAGRAFVAWPRRGEIGQLALAGVLVCGFFAPVLARNVVHYGTWALTPQAGAYVAYWLVPLVRESKNGVLWSQGAADMQKKARERYGDANLSNPFQSSRQLVEIGREELLALGPVAIAQAWLFGAAINLAAPAVIISPPIFTRPRTGFYDTPGDSRAAKIFNFVFRSSNTIYALALLLGVGGVLIVRLIQAVGVFAVLRTPGAIMPALLFGAWFGFVLMLNGPIASPKYRLPIEAPLMVLSGAGFATLRDRWRARVRVR